RKCRAIPSAPTRFTARFAYCKRFLLSTQTKGESSGVNCQPRTNAAGFRVYEEGGRYRKRCQQTSECWRSESRYRRRCHWHRRSRRHQKSQFHRDGSGPESGGRKEVGGKKAYEKRYKQGLFWGAVRGAESILVDRTPRWPIFILFF